MDLNLTETYKDQTCIHGHRYNTGHNNCFHTGKVKTKKAPEEIKDREPVKVIPKFNIWYEQEGVKVGYLDIETTGLIADFSQMLGWCIKEKNGSTYSDTITKEELFTGKFDKRIVESCINKMLEFDVIVTYNGTLFDNSYLRAKALRYRLPFPSFVKQITITKSGKEVEKTVAEIVHFDLYFLVKSKFKISRKSLDNICDWLGIVGKTPLSKDTWRKATYGDPESLKEVMVHCEGDVAILEELHNRVKELSKWDRKPL